MNESWIKLYRKVLNNEVWKDKTAWRIFSWLLLVCNRTSGSFTVGRYQGARETGLKPTTFYQTLKRLEKYGIVSQKMTPKYTVVNIVNWGRYQGHKGQTVTKLSTTYEQQSDNKMTLIKSEEITTNLEKIKNIKQKTIEHIRNL